MFHKAMGHPVLAGRLQNAFPNAFAEYDIKLRGGVMAVLLVVIYMSLEQKDRASN